MFATDCAKFTDKYANASKQHYDSYKASTLKLHTLVEVQKPSELESNQTYTGSSHDTS